MQEIRVIWWIVSIVILAKKALMKYEVPDYVYEDQVKIAGILDVIYKKIVVNN